MKLQFVCEAQYSQTMSQTVLPLLRDCMREGTFRGTDGNPLHWYAFRSDHAKYTLVLLHGFTESARKYAEMIYYFLQSGANVYLYDQRGHGESYRHVEDTTLTHVDRFSDYVKDLGCFMEQIVPRDLPLRLYAHSMGGAVSTLYIESHPAEFEKAVLSSPMIAPVTGGYPLFMGKAICYLMIALGKSKKRIFLSGEYPGEEPFEGSCASSEPRFRFYELQKRTTPFLRNYAPTYRWTLESMKVTRQILRKNLPEKVQTEILLCSADDDTAVLNPPQRKLAERLPHCRFRQYPARHEIYNSPDSVMHGYVEEVCSFLFA